MNLLKSRVSFVLSFIMGFFSAYILFCSFSRPFQYYAYQAFGFSPSDSQYVYVAAIFVFIASVVVFAVASINYAETTNSGTWRRINKFDYIITTIFYFTIFLVCAAVLATDPNIFSMAICPLFGYSAFMLWFMSTLYRIKSRTFMKTMRWLLFFRVYKPYKLVGFSAAFFSFLSFVMLVFGIYTEQAPIIIISFGSFLLLTYCAELCIQLDIIKNNLIYDLKFAELSEFLPQLQPVVSELSSFSFNYDNALGDKIKSERFKTELITNVSHDIKTPLTSIINYIDLLKKLDIKNDSFAEYILVLDKKSQRLRLLIEDLMEATKAGTGNIAVHFSPINLTELLGQLAGELDEKLLAKNLQLIMRQPESDCIVNADGKHLWRVMENIFGNAVKYSLSGTRIYAEISRDESHIPPKICFSLKNISQEQLPTDAGKLAQQFVRGDEARRSEGSGLGLYIAKSLSEIMGYSFTINVYGDTFEVKILIDTVDRQAL